MPDLERILQLTPGTLSQQWYEDGAAVDPGTVTLGITKGDGTVLVAAGQSTTGTGTNPRTFNLTTTHTANLDFLKVTWTSTLKGTLISYVEVVGGYLFSISEARALAPLNDTTAYPTADIVSMRVTVEQAIEQACGCAFVPRYQIDTLDGDGTWVLQLSRPLVTAVRSGSIRTWGSSTPVALSASDITALSLSTTGALYSSQRVWEKGIGNVIVNYEHGFQDTPVEVKRAAVLLAKMWLTGNRSPIDDRAITFNAGAEGGTYSLAVPGRGGSYFGHPDIDSVIDRYSLVTRVV